MANLAWTWGDTPELNSLATGLAPKLQPSRTRDATDAATQRPPRAAARSNDDRRADVRRVLDDLERIAPLVTKRVALSDLGPPLAYAETDAWRLWHKEDEIFGLPRAAVLVLVRSGAFGYTARDAVYARLAVLARALTETPKFGVPALKKALDAVSLEGLRSWLDDKGGVWGSGGDVEADESNYAALLSFQTGTGPDARARTLALNAVLEAPFYDELRTKKQLGYVALAALDAAKLGSVADGLARQLEETPKTLAADAGPHWERSPPHRGLGQAARSRRRRALTPDDVRTFFDTRIAAGAERRPPRLVDKGAPKAPAAPSLGADDGDARGLRRVAPAL
ncbi:M16 peptidase-like protein [Aureococcus anophagefferens]|nr:M16 peptidase-like protein [Aureococcus anophagefferens]